MHTLFISDLHLDHERPAKLALFKKLLEGPARRAHALYILGDLFEAWAGDDDDTSPHPEIIAILAAYIRAGGRLYVMRGNRDFLLGKAFAAATGAMTIKDPTIIDLYGNKTLLMHGDTLCTRDIKYQIYRRLVNNPPAIKLFMQVPYSLRLKLWHGIRNLTRKTTARKPPAIIDVHQPAVEKAMRKHQVFTLIHGHTHRERRHEFELRGKKATRYVLGDWYEGDCVLVADKNELRLMRVGEYLATSGI